MLNDDQRHQLDAIDRELANFLEAELYHQAVERIDLILNSMGELEDYRLFRGALHARRAECFLELDDEDEAWKSAQKAMNLGWYTARVHSIAGWAMYHAEHYDTALEQFNRAIELDDQIAASFEGRALVHREIEDLDSARVDFSRAIQLAPSDASAYANRAEVDIELGALDSALSSITKARELDPDDPDYAHLAATLLVAKSDVDGALKALSAAAKSDDVSLEALLLRSVLRLADGNTKGAKEDAIRASNAYGDEAFAFVQLSQVQLADGNAQLALKAAERAVSLDPSLPDAYLARANAYRLKGEIEKSDADYDRAHAEPLEMMDFIFGPVAEHLDLAALQAPEIEEPQTSAPSDAGANPFAGLGGGGGMPNFGIPGLGGLNPAAMLDQVFDAEGNIKPAFRPIMKMAMKNAPSLLKTMPDAMLKQRGIDPTMLDNVDLDQIPEEQLEAQMKLFYKMVKSGQNPLENLRNPKSGD